jgi:hypothetical protein
MIAGASCVGGDTSAKISAAAMRAGLKVWIDWAVMARGHRSGVPAGAASWGASNARD